MTPRQGRIFHGSLAASWAFQAVLVVWLMWPPDWKMYLVEISLWANIATHLAGYSAERPSEVVKGGDKKSNN